MHAIRIRTRVNSDTLHLPELRPLVGKNVEIIVLEVNPEALPNSKSLWDDLYELAGTDVVDPNAYRALRSASMI